jgi:hypothetical protein
LLNSGSSSWAALPSLLPPLPRPVSRRPSASARVRNTIPATDIKRQTCIVIDSERRNTYSPFQALELLRIAEEVDLLPGPKRQIPSTQPIGGKKKKRAASPLPSELLLPLALGLLPQLLRVLLCRPISVQSSMHRKRERERCFEQKEARGDTKRQREEPRRPALERELSSAGPLRSHQHT